MVGLPGGTIQVWLAAPPLDQFWNWYRRPFNVCVAGATSWRSMPTTARNGAGPTRLLPSTLTVNPAGLVVTVASVLLGKMSRKTVW